MFRTLLATAALTATILAPASATSHLEVVWLAVGQGDAALYRAPCGDVGLVDANAGAADEVLAQLDAWGSRSELRWMSVSHYDADHLGDVQDVGQATGVGVAAVYDRGGDRTVKDSNTYRSYFDWVTGETVRQPVDIGDAFSLCSGADRVTFTVISAGTDGTAADGVAVTEENDRGVCLLVEYDDLDIATCGDVNGTDEGSRADVESAVAASYGDVDAVKVNHHGARFSSNETYVSTLSPQAAVIPVGKNSFGHPDPDVVARWDEKGRVFQTQHPDTGDPVDGNVTLTSTGRTSFAITTSASGVHDTFTLDEASTSSGHIRRFAGDDRIHTSVLISQATFPGDGAVDTVVIALAFRYPDALAGAPLARKRGGPILLTGGDRLDEKVADELRRLAPARAILLGGPEALSEDVEEDVRAAGVGDVSRIGGDDRFHTAQLVAAEVAGPDLDHVYVVEGADLDPGRGWPDAVSVAGLAARQGEPVLLVTTEALPPATRRAISDLGVGTATIVGGPAAVSTDVEQAIRDLGVTVARIAGDDRYDTSNRVAARARDLGADPARTWLATGLDFPDALAAGPAVAATDGILHLVHGHELARSPSTVDWIDEHACTFSPLTLTGGTAAISAAVEAAIRDRIADRCDPDPDPEPEPSPEPSPTPPPGSADVTITGVVADPAGDDVAFDGGEYLTVRNDASSNVTMTGWYVLDAANNRLNWCGISIAPGATARLYSGDGNDGADHCHAGRGSAALNNDGDTLRLYDPGDNLVDTFSY
ncbi:MAG: cell wall-binding repeat-containing protein [Actinobacteria bacterium]|nr:cell wall-binding repeat-containing protein [Actinomycetota bacterium]